MDHKGKLQTGCIKVLKRHERTKETRMRREEIEKVKREQRVVGDRNRDHQEVMKKKGEK